MRNIEVHSYEAPFEHATVTVHVREFDMVLYTDGDMTDVHVSCETMGCHQSITASFASSRDTYVVDSIDEFDPHVGAIDMELYANVVAMFIEQHLS